MGEGNRYNRADEAAYDYIRRTGRWPTRDDQHPTEARERPVEHSKPTLNARPADAPNYATVDERGVETPVDVGTSAHPPAE